MVDWRGRYFSALRLGSLEDMMLQIYSHLDAYFWEMRTRAYPERFALAVLPTLCTYVSPLIGTLNWITLLMVKSRPLAATSVEIRIFVFELWNFYSFYSLCFCIMWECRVKDFRPAKSMKNFTRLEALIVLVKMMHLASSGSSWI